ncbi:MAG: signal peptidase I [Myxococcota bacterium]
MSDELENDEVDAPDLDDHEDDPPRSIGHWLWEVFKTWGPAILAIVVIRVFVFQPFSIPSTSMVPTLLIGDHVVVTKYSYGLWVPNPTSYQRWEIWDWADPQHGDIIVFRFPNKKAVHYIKRVVAVAGDKIEVQNNQIVLNGVVQPRTTIGQYEYQDDCVTEGGTLWTEDLNGMTHAKLTDKNPSPLASRGPFTVPEGHVFVMGDNRDNSGDSRQWGMVDEELIMGKAQFVWVSFRSCDGSITTDLRWGRMGQGLYGEIEPNVAEGAVTNW